MKQLQTQLLVALCALFMCSCTIGIKSWPQPSENQDKFEWRSITATYEGSCLVVEGRVSGSYENLDTIYLYIESLTASGCADCPFHPSRILEFRKGNSKMEVVGPWLKVQACGLDTTIAHRLKLEGTNRLTGLSPTSSKIIRIDP